MSRFPEHLARSAGGRVGGDRLAHRLEILFVVVALVIGSFAFFAASSVPGRSPASTPALRASAVTPSIWYNYSDFFNVPYGEWWDMRTGPYGDEPVGASCFNATSVADGTCTTNIGGLNRFAHYPWMDWAGSGSANSEGSVTNVYAPYRAHITAYNEPGYNLSSPVFLPVLNYTAAPGSTLSFNWNMQYLDKATYNTLTSAPLSCYAPSGANANDGYQLQSKIYLTLDNQEAARLFGSPATGTLTQMRQWWTQNTFAGCGTSTTGKNPQQGPVETAVTDWFDQMGNTKYDIWGGYVFPYTPLYTNITATVVSAGPTGTTNVYIEHGAWGTEVLLDRFFYWGNASYAGNQMNSGKAAGWWNMENGWWEGLHYAGKMTAAAMNFNLTGVLQYHFQEHSAPGPDNCFRQQTTCTEVSPSDDTPYWTWGPMLLDYVPSSNSHPYSELDRFAGKTYIKTTPGSGDYGTNTSYDYTPVSWVPKSGEQWNFQFPTNSSKYYQNPATAPFGTDPLKTSQLPAITSSLFLKQIFPAGVGTWNGVAGTWTVNGGTSYSWPASTGTGTYPVIPYPGIYLQPANIPPGVTTQPASAILSTSATLNGNLVSLGSSYTAEVGFRWGTSPTLATYTNVSVGTVSAIGPFSQGIASLTLGQTYYFQAWANAVGFVRGTIMSFNTAATPPTVVTTQATGVSTSAATLNGDLTGLGTASSVEVGFLYGTDSTLATSSNQSAGTVTAIGTFNWALSGLTSGTTYYFQAWANGDGFTKAPTIEHFTTATASPTVFTDQPTVVYTTTANLNGHTTNLGTAASVEVGFWWGTSPTLATYTNDSIATQTTPGGFVDSLSGLTSATTYYFQAWANGNGFSQGLIVSFTTGATTVTPPSVTTNGATTVTTTGATLNGDLTVLGTAPTVTVGFLWGTDSTLVTNTNDTVGPLTAAGTFTDALTILTKGTTYYFQAWANGDGFAHGVIASFTTAVTPPTVATGTASSIGQTGATLNGVTSTLGTAASVPVGFLWGTSSTLASATNVTATSQTTAGAFTSALTGLTAGTTYYFQAWANGDGFVAGTVVNFATTSPTAVTPPTVTTSAVSGLSSSGATLNGNLGALGSASSVTVGFLWGTDSGLSGAANVSLSAALTATGAFTTALTGLSPGTTYYFEAWGNGAGFAHGSIQSFTTPAVTPTEQTFLGLPLLVGYALVAVIIIAVVVVVALLMMRRRKQSPPSPPPSP